MEIIEKRVNQRKIVVDEATDFSNHLEFKCTSILIGSYARGDFNLWSDVDLLIIGDFKAKNPIERLKYVDFPPGYEVILLTTGEVKKMKERNNKFITDALKDGVFLRDDFHFIES